MRYRAIFRKAGMVPVETRWHESPIQAQDRLKDHPRVGWFAYLGSMVDDPMEKHPLTAEKWCHQAPRNGGIVNLLVSTGGRSQRPAR